MEDRSDGLSAFVWQASLRAGHRNAANSGFGYGTLAFAFPWTVVLAAVTEPQAPIFRSLLQTLEDHTAGLELAKRSKAAIDCLRCPRVFWGRLGFRANPITPEQQTGLAVGDQRPKEGAST